MRRSPLIAAAVAALSLAPVASMAQTARSAAAAAANSQCRRADANERHAGGGNCRSQCARCCSPRCKAIRRSCRDFAARATWRRTRRPPRAHSRRRRASARRRSMAVRPGFGAGDTGFDSSNTPKSKKKKLKAQSAASARPRRERAGDHLRSAVDDAVQRARQADADAALAGTRRTAARTADLSGQGRCPDRRRPAATNASRCRSATCRPKSIRCRRRTGPGASVPVPLPIDTDASVSTPPPGTQPINTLPLGTPPQRLLPLGDGDPYSPLGIRGGSFIFFPAVELSTACCHQSARHLRAAALRRISSWRRNCWCNPTGRGIRSPPHHQLLHRIHQRQLRSRRSTVRT